MKFLKNKVKWKEYKSYPDKITFKAKCGSNGTIKISKTLDKYSNLDFLYVKIDNRIRKFKITKGHDRGMLIYRAYVKRKYSGKELQAYLKTTISFKNIMIKALSNKKDILKEYTNPNFRLYVSEEGQILLRFLINLSSKNKISQLTSLFNKSHKTITLKTYKHIINKFEMDSKLFSPFIKNYYTQNIVKEELEEPNYLVRPKARPKIFRLVGLINGDGTLTKYGAYFFNDDYVLHQDFIEISKFLDNDIGIKYEKVKTTSKTCWYSVKLANKLNQHGAIYNRKLDFLNNLNIDKDIFAYSEYLSGIYDTEGTIIKDSNIIIPSSVTVYNENINILTKNELECLFLLAKNQGIFKRIEDTGSEYYRIGLNKLKKNKKYRLILKKLRNHYPGLALSHKKILDNIKINSKLELKFIDINFRTNRITAAWWLKINLIEDVIKFVSIIEPHIERKAQKLNNFISNYITLADLNKIRDFVYEDGIKNLGFNS